MKRLSLSRTKILNLQSCSILVLGLASLLMVSPPALAHHPLGERLPANAFEGFLSGIAHPMIGVDHFVFVIAAGLVGALASRGIIIPIAFIMASLGGTGLHLLSFDAPAPEAVISASVVAFGIVLALGLRSNLILVSTLGVIAGLFHGYAYGEAIVGAEMTPLLAYLLGFFSIQLVISLAAWKIGKLQLAHNASQGLLNLRFVGFAIAGVGTAFLSGILLS